jgi:SAM-dependent methyltransferase
MNVKKYSKLPKTDPGLVFDLRDGSFAADLFIAAVSELDFFTWLQDRPSDLGGICSALRLAERPADVMLTLFKSYRLVREENGVFRVTETAAEFLSGGSPWDVGSYVRSLRDRPVCAQMLEVLRTGKPQAWSAKPDGRDWASSMENEDFARSFSNAQNSRGAYLAAGLAKTLDLSRRRKILDIGGSTGIYTAVLLDRFPNLSGTVFEKGPVDRIARANIDDFRMTGRIDVVQGDMFSDQFPPGHDVHLISNVLHDWDVTEVERILRNSYASLEPGGLLVIHDAHLNEVKTGPVSVAEYSVLLMFSTEGKCYSIAELRPILERIGFTKIEFKPTVINRSVITAVK